MDDLVQSIFLTSVLVSILLTGYIKYRNEDCFYVSDAEKCISVVVLIISFIVLIVTSFILIWI